MTTDDRVLALVAVAAAGVYSWVAAGLRPFTVEQEVMVAIPAVVVLVAALRPSRAPGRGAALRTSRGSAALWLGLAGLAVIWELVAFFSSPRSDHPTLSVMADEVMSVHPGRALIFLLWLTLGWLLVRTAGVARR